jgi:hypothetical protein
MKFSARSLFKLSSSSATDETTKLKQLTKDKEFMKEVDRRVRHIISQGVSSRLSGKSTKTVEQTYDPENRKED